jgi:hypothetical protein
MGVIQGTVLAVLDKADEPMRSRDIHDAVERCLGRAVSCATVASFLSVASRDASTPITRTGIGLYAATGC